MSKDIELTPETFRWLYTFVQGAIEGGLLNQRAFVPESVYRELSNHELLEVADDAGGWGKLTDSFAREIVKGINVYAIIRGIVYERSQE